MKKALVVSGGGAFGAWGAGIAKGLNDFHGKDYDMYVGTSTGSLMVPLIASKEFDQLQEAYTNVTSKSIYKINPFKKDGSIKILNAIWRFITGKTSLGDSSNLRKTIDNFVTSGTYAKIVGDGKDVSCCVVNLSKTHKAEYFSLNDCTLDEYKDWMEASASAPFALNLINKNGNQYTDGGIIDSIPVEQAIKNGCTEIDVIVHKVKGAEETSQKKVTNLLNLAVRVIEVIFGNIFRDDIRISSVHDDLKEDVKINYYYMPYRFQENSLVFDKDKMTRMFNIGYLSMNRKDKYSNIVSTITLSAKKGKLTNKKSYFAK